MSLQMTFKHGNRLPPKLPELVLFSILFKASPQHQHSKITIKAYCEKAEGVLE